MKTFINKWIASQLRKPRGLFGKIVLSRILNRENSIMNETTLELLNLKPSDQTLEIGFGGGALLSLMLKTQPQNKLYGADFSLDMVTLCRQKFSTFINKHLMQLDYAPVNKLPYKANTFTKICSVNTFYFWHDYSLALKELRRILRDNGVLVLTLGDKNSMQKSDITQHGFNLFTYHDVIQLLEAEGFKITQVKEENDKSGSFFCVAAIKH